jgi:hypothetical protein
MSRAPAPVKSRVFRGSALSGPLRLLRPGAGVVGSGSSPSEPSEPGAGANRSEIRWFSEGGSSAASDSCGVSESWWWRANLQCPRCGIPPTCSESAAMISGAKHSKRGDSDRRRQGSRAFSGGCRAIRPPPERDQSDSTSNSEHFRESGIPSLCAYPQMHYTAPYSRRPLARFARQGSKPSEKSLIGGHSRAPSSRIPGGEGLVATQYR